MSATRRHPLAASALVITALVATPAGAQEKEPEEEPAPAGSPAEDEVMRYPPSSVRFGLIAGGAGVFAVSYGLSAMSAALWPGTPGSKWLYAPVIGPWGALATGGCSEDDPDCTPILVVRSVLYVLDGLVQAGALGLLGEGIFMTTEAEADTPEAPEAPEGSRTKRRTRTSMMLVPSVSSERAGIDLVGTF
jgi:hypothetical protein